MLSLLSTRYGRLNRLGRFVDAWFAAGHAEHEGVTAARGKRIDFCFVPDALASQVRSAHVDASTEGCDHPPFWVDTDHL
ncbi:MAG: hypothetical protein ABI440_09085 [Casimicrobiaceae bacterium]